MQNGRKCPFFEINKTATLQLVTSTYDPTQCCSNLNFLRENIAFYNILILTRMRNVRICAEIYVGKKKKMA